MKKIAQSFVEKIKDKSKNPTSFILFLTVWAAIILSTFILVFIIGYIFVGGIKNISPSLFSFKYNSQNLSMLPSIINTVLMVIIALLIAGPLGIFTAIYLVEYAKKGSKVVKIIRVTAETLSGIPSIVYGLFGMLFFVTYLNLNFSLLSGSLTVSIMILPLMIRATEEALKGVDNRYREGSFGLGAGRLRTVFKIVLPSAVPGILAGVILSVGRIVGETAALIFTAGTVAKIPENLFSSTRTLSVHMYILSSEGIHVDTAYATGVVIIMVVIIINISATLLAKKFKK